MSVKKSPTDFQAWGLSPKGGNAQEVTGPGTAFAPVRNTDMQGVPLYLDPESGAFVSKLAIQEQEDRAAAINLAEKWNEDQEFRNQAGFTRS